MDKRERQGYGKQREGTSSRRAQSDGAHRDQQEAGSQHAEPLFPTEYGDCASDGDQWPYKKGKCVRSLVNRRRRISSDLERPAVNRLPDRGDVEHAGEKAREPEAGQHPYSSWAIPCHVGHDDEEDYGFDDVAAIQSQGLDSI